MVLSSNILKYKIYLKGKAGIYMIKNIYNGKVYVGSTGDLYHRVINHKSALLKGNHNNGYLQRAVNKNGIDCFEFKVLKFVVLNDKTCLMKDEQFYIDLYKPEYNIQPFAYLNRGYRHTKEAIEKIRLSGIGRKTNNREVLQFDKNDNFIREWSSVVEINKTLKFCTTNICKVCKNYESNGRVYKYYHDDHGFIWKYKIERKGSRD